MAWRIHDHVVRGELDNRVRGRIAGRIWLEGVAEPLALTLKGDAHPDLAGCLLTFKNPKPIAMTTKPPVGEQRGMAGDFTAARKVRVPDVPLEEFVRMKNGPWHWANALYIEWFCERCGRVVIESTDFELSISEPAWRFTAEELAEREREREEGRSEFEIAVEHDGEDAPWDEFRHEQMLRESDALSEKYGRLLQKYKEHPDCEEIVAREMGWRRMDEEVPGCEEAEEDEEEEEEDFESEKEAILEEALSEDAPEPPEPDPEREGIDWVRDKDGDIVHPIEKRASEALGLLFDETKKNPALEQTEDEDFGDFLGHFMSVSAKLAGALGGIARGWRETEEAGFTIALLKRVLEYLHQAIAAGERLSGKKLLSPERLAFFRAELFGIREEILALITRLRG